MTKHALTRVLSLSDDDASLQYSEDSEGLKMILETVEIKTVFQGIRQYFPDDEYERIVLRVYISRNGKTISFTYGISIRDTESVIAGEMKEVIEGLLYSILVSIALDYYCPGNFHDFCSEYGYDEDSRKAERIYIECLPLSKKLQGIFTEEEIAVFPHPAGSFMNAALKGGAIEYHR